MGCTYSSSVSHVVPPPLLRIVSHWGVSRPVHAPVKPGGDQMPLSSNIGRSDCPEHCAWAVRRGKVVLCRIVNHGSPGGTTVAAFRDDRVITLSRVSHRARGKNVPGAVGRDLVHHFSGRALRVRHSLPSLGLCDCGGGDECDADGGNQATRPSCERPVACVVLSFSWMCFHGCCELIVAERAPRRRSCVIASPLPVNPFTLTCGFPGPNGSEI